MGAGRRIPNKFPMPRIGILNLWAWNVSGRGGPLADDQINSSFVLRTSFLFSFFFPLFHHIHSISFCFFFRFCFFFFFACLITCLSTTRVGTMQMGINQISQEPFPLYQSSASTTTSAEFIIKKQAGKPKNINQPHLFSRLKTCLN